MNNPSIPMTAVEIAGYAHYSALASDIGWSEGFKPEHIEVDGLGNGNPFELVKITEFGGVESLKYQQLGDSVKAWLYVTIIGA